MMFMKVLPGKLMKQMQQMRITSYPYTETPRLSPTPIPVWKALFMTDMAEPMKWPLISTNG